MSKTQDTIEKKSLSAKLENSQGSKDVKSTNHSQKSEHIGILLKILSGICFSIMSGLIKYLDGNIPLGELIFFRSAVALIPLIIFLKWSADFPSGLHTKNPLKHIVRCIFGALAMFCSFEALALLPIAEHTALFYLSPIFLVIFAVFMLKERVSSRRWVGVGFGLLGLVVLTAPNFSINLSSSGDKGILLGIGLVVLSAVLAAVALLQVRQLTQMGENTGAITFYFALTTTVVGLISMIHHWVDPEPWQLACLIAIGMVGGIAQILMTLAFKYAEASALATYDYISIVWGVLIGLVVFNEIPDMFFWIAMPLIIMGAIIAKPVKKN